MSRRHEDSDEDTYVSVGSAFELLETPEDIQRAKGRKEKELYVTDSKGRRRFHGAFTGGFSAGYFNTVGSEEGWSPSGFISSREKKADYGQQKPEDFMDEEDFGNYGIAPKAIAAKDEFSEQKAGSKRASSQPSVIPGVPPLQNLIVPSRSTVGAQLLLKMGWREGEGVGPKVMKYPPKTQEKKGAKVYGCARPGEDEEQQPEYARVAEGFLFAPRDTAPWQFEGKDDLHGIGYSGMQEQAVLASQGGTKALYGMSGHAFGIGALEEEDDEDVYGVESLTSYDVALAGEGDITMERKYGWTGGPESDSWSLSSFMKASKPLLQHKKYPPPSVPQDFVPIHKFTVPALKGSDVSDVVTRKPLTSTERTQMLADKPGSVFSLMSAEDRDRLKKVTELAKQQVDGQQSHSNSEKSKPLALHHEQPQAWPQTSSKFSLEQLKPFAPDSVKQARYEAYLSGKQNPSEYSSMTEWERQKEWKEFTHAARVYQPLTTSLASRFTRAQNVEDKEERPKSPESDAVQAAKAGMFGVLTREVLEWHPHRVLCKRFNIPDPYPSSGLVGRTAGEDSKSSDQRTMKFLHTERMTDELQQGFEAGLTQRKEEVSLGGKESHQQGVEGAKATDESIMTGEDGGGKEDKEEEEKPPMDLFKAIFAESSSESEESDMENEQSQENQATTMVAEQNILTQRATLEGGGTTKWQDLSLVSTRIPIGNTPAPSRWDPETTPVTQSKKPDEGCATKRHVENVMRTQDRVVTESQISTAESFGPALPPDLNKEGHVASNSKHPLHLTHSSQRHSKHKHKHHKTPHRKKGHDGKKDHKHKHSKHNN